NNHWVGLYSNTMEDAKIMIDKYSATDPYYTGMAQVLMAINLGVATDLWGDVPYSKAFQGDKNVFVAPADPQQSVIASIQSLLDGAIANFAKAKSANVDVPNGDDLYYGGNVTQWTKAAWTLKARYANRLSLRDPQSATNVLADLANGITSAADNMENPHPAAGNSQNQWGAYQNQRAGNMVANKFFVDMLNANSDPRLPYYLSKDKNGAYTGADVTQETINVDASTIGTYFDVAQNYPLVTSYEASFLAAEAKARLGQDASADLNAGIKASVARATGGNSDGSLIATYTLLTATQNAVLTEKWKAMYGQIEAYNDYRRTGIPAVTVRPESAGATQTAIPKRLPYPEVETNTNPNIKLIDIMTPVWWATSN
ncbi:MAG TPA: SusD/RagB family nutrient-binding outer membrane lipoprotein, partial [Mucilaginibacter sp.]|nr:SusD/RagB family nutrient-binding outer membrane lipoprotein [Mucilaginibacter sp.]